MKLYWYVGGCFLYLYVTSMGEDFVDRIDLEKHSRDSVRIKSYNNKHLPLNIYSKYLCGPHRLILDENRKKIYTLNCYDNSISVIDKEKFEFEGSWYVGLYPVDGVLYNGNIFIVNADSNSVTVFDIEGKRVIGQFKVGNYPQKIIYNSKYNLFFVSNMNSGDILLIEPENYTILDFIITGPNPTDIIFSEDEEYLYVANSYFDSGENGKISIIDLRDFKIVKEINAGKVPIKIYKENDFLYILNAHSNTFCRVHLVTKDKEEVYCGEAPSDFCLHDRYVYVASLGDNKIYIFDVANMEKVGVIKTRKEPSGLIIDQ